MQWNEPAEIHLQLREYGREAEHDAESYDGPMVWQWRQPGQPAMRGMTRPPYAIENPEAWPQPLAGKIPI